MHLLYLDDSGSSKNKADRHVILAGLSVFERGTHWLSQSLERIAEEAWPDNPSGIEFHGTEMWTGKKHWRGHEKTFRDEIMRKALRTISGTNQIRLFGAAIHKRSVGADDPMEFAFEVLANRFDRMLGRLYRSDPKNPQRGLMVLDDSTYESSFQTLSIQFRSEGHRWGKLFNLADAPLFVNSRATRLVQAAGSSGLRPSAIL